MGGAGEACQSVLMAKCVHYKSEFCKSLIPIRNQKGANRYEGGGNRRPQVVENTGFARVFNNVCVGNYTVEPVAKPPGVLQLNGVEGCARP